MATPEAAAIKSACMSAATAVLEDMIDAAERGDSDELIPTNRLASDTQVQSVSNVGSCAYDAYVTTQTECENNGAL